MALVMFDEQILLDPERIVLIREFGPYPTDGKIWCHIHLLGVKEVVQVDKPIGEVRDQLWEAIGRKTQNDHNG